MKKKYYVRYRGSNVVLEFDEQKERDEYVLFEKIVHPECSRASYSDVKHLIRGKSPKFDNGFGCMAYI